MKKEITDAVFNHIGKEMNLFFYHIPNNVLEDIKKNINNNHELIDILKAISTAVICMLFEREKIILKRKENDG